MSLVLQHIDQIALQKNRDVLFIHFEDYQEQQQDSTRQQVLSWLDQNGIEYVPCMGLAEEGYIDSYMGDVYVDVLFDGEDPLYQELSQYLEDEQGNMKIEGVYFFLLSLETAQELEAARQPEDLGPIQ